MILTVKQLLKEIDMHYFFYYPIEIISIRYNVPVDMYARQSAE